MITFVDVIWSVAGGDKSPVDIVGIIGSTGIAGFAGLLYWNERKERIEAQTFIREFLLKYAPALENSTEALERVQGSMAQQVLSTQTSKEEAMKRLEEQVSKLAQRLGEGK